MISGSECQCVHTVLGSIPPLASSDTVMLNTVHKNIECQTSCRNWREKVCFTYTLLVLTVLNFLGKNKNKGRKNKKEKTKKKRRKRNLRKGNKKQGKKSKGNMKNKRRTWKRQKKKREMDDLFFIVILLLHGINKNDSLFSYRQVF